MSKILYFNLDCEDEKRLKELADEILLRDQLDNISDKQYDFCTDLIDLSNETYIKRIYDKYKNKFNSLEHYYNERENLKEEFKKCKITKKRKKLKSMMDEIEKDMISIIENSNYPLPEREKISLDSNILEVKKSIDALIMNCDMTDDEIDIYFMLKDGYTCKEIAEIMNTNHLKIHMKVNTIKDKLYGIDVDYNEHQ